jgi:site-specific recombinase XerD
VGQRGGRPEPVANADRPPEGDHSPDVLHLDDIRSLVAACKGRAFDDMRDAAIIRVMFDTGTRLGELAGIQLDDWGTRQDFLLVDGKSGPRLVPMTASTAEALARYVRRARNRHAHQQPASAPARPTRRSAWATSSSALAVSDGTVRVDGRTCGIGLGVPVTSDPR